MVKLQCCEHSMVIGGTGMLREASVVLARASQVMTSVARTATSLLALDARVGASCKHHWLQSDWTRREAFLDLLKTHLRKVGMPQRILIWAHDETLASDVAGLLATDAPVCRMFHVVGSAAAAPDGPDRAPGVDAARYPSLDYRKIVLGFQLESGSSRWLRDEEIVAGVVDAIWQDTHHSVVGVVVPWHRRP